MHSVIEVAIDIVASIEGPNTALSETMATSLAPNIGFLTCQMSDESIVFIEY
jgi:hypothetical protein